MFYSALGRRLLRLQVLPQPTCRVLLESMLDQVYRLNPRALDVGVFSLRPLDAHGPITRFQEPEAYRLRLENDPKLCISLASAFDRLNEREAVACEPTRWNDRAQDARRATSLLRWPEAFSRRGSAGVHRCRRYGRGNPMLTVRHTDGCRTPFASRSDGDGTNGHRKAMTEVRRPKALSEQVS